MPGLRLNGNTNFFVEAPNFRIEEFVSRATFTKWGRLRSLWFIDPKIILGHHLLRDIINVPMTVNDWYKPTGRFTGRGYRDPSQYVTGQFKSNPISESQHRFGRAGDSSSSLGSRKMFEAVMDNKLKFLEVGITCLEDFNDTPTWLHMDCRQHSKDDSEIIVVKP